MRLPGHVLNPPLEVVNHASNEAAEDEERIVALVVTLPKVRLNLGKAGATYRVRQAECVEPRPVADTNR